jgi:hypothetical protein
MMYWGLLALALLLSNCSGTYVVPVPLALLQCVALEFEASHPSTALLWVLGERKLTCVVIPGAEEMHRFAPAGCAERKVELDSCHCVDPIRLVSFS